MGCNNSKSDGTDPQDKPQNKNEGDSGDQAAEEQGGDSTQTTGDGGEQQETSEDAEGQ